MLTQDCSIYKFQRTLFLRLGSHNNAQLPKHNTIAILEMVINIKPDVI